MISPTLFNLFQELETWTKVLYGERTQEIPLRKLEKELKELQEDNTNLEEYADCLIVLCDAARLAGFTAEQLIQMALDKLEICKTRVWIKQSDGTFQHKE